MEKCCKIYNRINFLNYKPQDNKKKCSAKPKNTEAKIILITESRIDNSLPYFEQIIKTINDIIPMKRKIQPKIQIGKDGKLAIID